MSENTEALQDLESLTEALGASESTTDEQQNKENKEDEIIVVEDDTKKDDSKEDEEFVEEDTNEILEEERPKKKFKRDKRIEGLLKKNTAKDSEIEELKKQINELSIKDQERTNKEAAEEFAILDAKKKEAFESSNYEDFKQYESEIEKIKRPQQMTAQEAEDYFKSKNSWYGVDKARTFAAQGIHSEVLSDDNYRHLTPKQQLDLVAKQVDDMPEFKKNPYQQSSPTEGAPISRPSNNQVTITRSQLEHVRLMYPELNERELKIRTRELVTAVSNLEDK